MDQPKGALVVDLRDVAGHDVQPLVSDDEDVGEVAQPVR